MVEETDFNYIQTRLDERYVKKDDCNEISSETERRIDKIFTDVAIIRTKQNAEIAILGAIGGAVLTIAVKLLFGA